MQREARRGTRNPGGTGIFLRQWPRGDKGWGNASISAAGAREKAIGDAREIINNRRAGLDRRETFSEDDSAIPSEPATTS